MIFDNYYNQFICENNLWTGIDYTDDESKLNLDIKKNIIKKYLSDSEYKINLLEITIDKLNNTNSSEKLDYYMKKKATQLCRNFKYQKQNYQRIKYNIQVTKISKSKNRISNSESNKKIVIIFNLSDFNNSFNLVYEKEYIYADDGHDYYLLNELEPNYEFDYFYDIYRCKENLEKMAGHIYSKLF